MCSNSAAGPEKIKLAKEAIPHFTPDPVDLWKADPEGYKAGSSQRMAMCASGAMIAREWWSQNPNESAFEVRPNGTRQRPQTA